MVHLFDNYASFTNEIFGQLLSNYSRYAANLNMKAVSFFYSSCTTTSSRAVSFYWYKMHCGRALYWPIVIFNCMYFWILLPRNFNVIQTRLMVASELRKLSHPTEISRQGTSAMIMKWRDHWSEAANLCGEELTGGFLAFPSVRYRSVSVRSM